MTPEEHHRLPIQEPSYASESQGRPNVVARASLTPAGKIELSKLELQLIAARTTSLVDTLWKVRNLSITLFAAVLAITVGGFAKQQRELVLPLLIMAAVVPICFMVGDVRNNRWCRRLLVREQVIHKYLSSEVEDEAFVPFEPRSVTEARLDSAYEWETSHFRSVADPNALSIYGAELCFVAIAIAIHVSKPWAWLLPLLPLFVALSVFALSQRLKQAKVEGR